MSDARFGFSTRPFQDSLLSREHLVHIAAHGFGCVELAATRSHFDYRSVGAIENLAEWLSDTRLDLHSVHAPVVEAVRNGTGIGWYSNASSDEARRLAALDEAKAALAIAHAIPYEFLVVHLGVPAVAPGSGADNQREAARRSAEALIASAAEVGVRVAFELIPNPLSTADALVRMIEDDLDGLDASLCLDYGHGHLTGDLADVIEAVAGHIVTTHLHDNDGRRDAHLLPYSGTIDWAAAMTETQKIGYDGVLMFEVASGGEPDQLLSRAARVRERLAGTLITFKDLLAE